MLFFLTNVHNILIITAVVVLMVILCFVVIFNKKLLDIAPAILTSSGILFTFVGITIGLYNFNTNGDPSNNINELLSGLKLAFVPSAFAVFLSIITKFFIAKKTDINVVSDFRTDIQEISTVIKECFGNMSNQLMGFQNELITRQAEILTVSLQQLFDDFNLKISDSLGDSFKLLSTSVSNLCVWQEDYKKLLIQVRDDYVNTLEYSINTYEITKNSAEVLTNMVADYKNIEISIGNIGNTLLVTHNNIETNNNKLINNTNELNNILEQKLNLVNKHMIQCNDILSMFSNTTNTMFNRINDMITTKLGA